MWSRQLVQKFMVEQALRNLFMISQLHFSSYDISVSIVVVSIHSSCFHWDLSIESIDDQPFGYRVIQNIWALVIRKAHFWCVMSHMGIGGRGVIWTKVIVIRLITIFEQKGADEKYWIPLPRTVFHQDFGYGQWSFGMEALIDHLMQSLSDFYRLFKTLGYMKHQQFDNGMHQIN